MGENLWVEESFLSFGQMGEKLNIEKFSLSLTQGEMKNLFFFLFFIVIFGQVGKSSIFESFLLLEHKLRYQMSNVIDTHISIIFVLTIHLASFYCFLTRFITDITFLSTINNLSYKQLYIIFCEFLYL